jgi:hypothetical protein
MRDGGVTSKGAGLTSWAGICACEAVRERYSFRTADALNTLHAVENSEASYPGELSVVGEAVQTLYGRYREDRFLVNRRYQRKLVWTVEEKIALIDSLIQQMPVPLILLADRDSGTYEVVDGLQRLNAIFSFIENEFAVAGGYFDLGTLADTIDLRDSGQLKQQRPILDRDVCRRISNYIVPSSSYRSPSDKAVDEVFRRINSGGHQLSAQEIRQAGTLTGVAEVVRKVAAEIRQDSSLDDLLALRQMQQISITNRDLPYGINVDELLWVKNGILTREQVRESRDEEVVLDLLADLLLDPMAPTGTSYRDAYYGLERGSSQKSANNRAESLASQLSIRGVDNVIDTFRLALDSFVATVDERDEGFGQLILKRPPPRIQRYFHAVFMTFLRAAAQGRHVNDYKSMADALEGIGDDMRISEGGVWSAENKSNVFQFVDARLETYFASGESASVQHSPARFENLLASAVTEQSAFEIKQGFLRLDDSREFDEDAFAKAIRAATAIANRGPNDPGGYLLFGVADSAEDAKRVETAWGTHAVKFRGFNVVGTEHELAHLEMTADRFMRDLAARVRAQPIPSSFAGEVIRNLKPVFYRQGHLVWIFRIAGATDAVEFDGDFFDRIGPSTEKVSAAGLQTFMGRFFVK